MAKSADAFRTISEVAEWLETPAHVLRFWESKFSQVKPVKRAGGRRYYRPSDMLLLGGIKKLLHIDGMTIKGVQKLLREQGIKHVAGHSQPLDDVTKAEVDDAAVETEEKSVSPPEETVADFRRDEAKKPPQPDDDPEGAPVVGQKPDAESAQPETAQQEEVEDVQTTKANEVAEPEDKEVSEAQEATSGAEVRTEEPAEEIPVMPSFSHRRAPPEATEEKQEAEAQPAAAAPKPKSVDLPDDPGDDVAADAGVLTQMTTLHLPMSDNMADRLKDVLDLLRQDGGGGSTGQDH